MDKIEEGDKFTASGLGKAIINDTQNAMRATRRNLEKSLEELVKTQEKIQSGFNDGSAPSVEKEFNLPVLIKTINNLIKVIDGANNKRQRPSS